MLNAVILAGEQPVKGSEHIRNKALFPINGKYMAEYVIDAVRNASGIGKIVVVGPEKELKEYFHDKVDAIIDSNGTIMENIRAAVNYLGYGSNLLICTSDIPMITPEAINDFVRKCEEVKGDLCYPIIEKRVNDVKYPGVERTYVKVREGVFTGGNIIYANPVILQRGYEFADRLLKARKNPLKMAWILGFTFMLQLMLGTLSIKRVEKKFSRLMDMKGKAIISEFPEIGNDVDKPSDVKIATSYLSEQVSES